MDEQRNIKVESKDIERKIINDQRSSRIHELLNLWSQYIIIFPNAKEKLTAIASELCHLLVKTKSFDALEAFLNKMPADIIESKDNDILKAKLYVALQRRNTSLVYRIIQDNYFKGDTSDLIKIWDEAHYIDEEKRTKRKLTALTRFRIRKRFLPPKTICKDGIRKTNALPKEATKYLRNWLDSHLHDPYPTTEEKQHLATLTGLTQSQVKTWFANARRRGKNYREKNMRNYKWFRNQRSGVDDYGLFSNYHDGKSLNTDRESVQ